MKKTADELYREIIDYKQSKAEAGRMAERQRRIDAIKKEMHELTKEGQTILQRVLNVDYFAGTYKGSERVTEIKNRLSALERELSGLTVMPAVTDDDYVEMTEELADTMAEIAEAEARHAEQEKELSQKRGKVPYKEFRSAEEKFYATDLTLTWLREKRDELREKVANYNRRSDRLFDEYKVQKDLEVKAWVTNKVQEIITYLQEAEEQKTTAEKVTFEAKGATVPKLLIPFGGDWYKAILCTLDEIMAILERG